MAKWLYKTLKKMGMLNSNESRVMKVSPSPNLSIFLEYKSSYILFRMVALKVQCQLLNEKECITAYELTKYDMVNFTCFHQKHRSTV